VQVNLNNLTQMPTEENVIEKLIAKVSGHIFKIVCPKVLLCRILNIAANVYCINLNIY